MVDLRACTLEDFMTGHVEGKFMGRSALPRSIATPAFHESTMKSHDIRKYNIV